jgi:Holliday junction resolvase
LNLDHKTAVRIATEILTKEGYEVVLDKKIGVDFSVDLVAVRGSDAVVMEFKPDVRIDSFDVMALESYTDALKNDPHVKSKKIHKLLLHKSASPLVGPLSERYGIELIMAKKRNEFSKDLLDAIK